MSDYKTLPEAFTKIFTTFSKNTAIRFRPKGSKEFTAYTYAEMHEEAQAIAVALISMGIKHQQKIGLIEDVGYQWLLTDTAIQLTGAIDVPRGTDSTDDELGFILSHSESTIAFVADSTEMEKVKKGLRKHKGKISTYILLHEQPAKKSRTVYGLQDLIAKGKELVAANGKEVKELENRLKKTKPEHLATLIYTSGTTGEPKGVMLTHANFAAQINILPDVLGATEKDVGLTLLPPWHIFGRIIEYVFFSIGAMINYTDIKNIGEDLRNVKPTYVPAVPRIWEGVYNKILAGVKKSGKEKIFLFFKGFALSWKSAVNVITGHEKLYVKRSPVGQMIAYVRSLFIAILYYPLYKLGDILVFKKVRAATGGRMRGSVSGGGALPSYIDDFFSAIGVNILEGYGLTETSPVLSVRTQDRIIPGTVGPLIPETEGKIIDADGNDITHIPGAKGTLHVRGPQIMKGYYKNPKKTKEALTKDGWFNTGDLVRFTVTGEMSIVGRSKDTIVLLGGENVEPVPIEDKIKESEFIDHVMIVGQDQKTLGALIVPNEEVLREFCDSHGIPSNTLAKMLSSETVKVHYRKLVQSIISPENGFKNFEKITAVHILLKPFEKGDELSNKLSLKRQVVQEKYEQEILALYN